MTNELLKTKILIAEDDPDTNRQLERILVNKGYEVVSTVDGLQALNKLKKDSPPQIVLLDWNMPELDGLEVVRQLRNNNVANEYIYTILVTARSDMGDILKGLKMGADDYIRKPYDKKELLARIRAGERVIHLERELTQKNKELEKANERMKKDLLIAADFQKSLLPTELPNNKKVKFEWIYEPCDELAGDLLNIFQLDDNHIGLFLLDVNGHGVAASFLTATLSRVLSPTQDIEETQYKDFFLPQKIANQLNKQFPLTEKNKRYFTIVYGVLNTASLEFRFICAGHPNPIYLNGSGKAKKIPSNGTPIGFIENEQYEEYSINLSSGDRLFFYSDGVKEVLRADNIIFGEERIRKVIEKTAQKPLKENISAILTAAKNFNPSPIKDDVTLLALEVV